MARGQDAADGDWRVPMSWAGQGGRRDSGTLPGGPWRMLSGKMGKEGVSNKGAAQQNLEVRLRTPILPRSQAGSF